MAAASSLLRLACAALAAAAAAAAGAPFGADSLLVLSVGDGATVLGNASQAARAVPVFLTEVSGSGAVLRAAWAVPGVTLADNDYTNGLLTLSADGASAAFAGLGAPAGTPSTFGAASGATGLAPACTTAGSCFAGYARIVAMVTSDGSVDTSTRLTASTYGGVIKGVCAPAGAPGFLVAGNDTAYGLAYVPRGATGSTIFQSHAGPSRNFVGCLVTPRGTLYTLRTTTVTLADSAPSLPADLTASYSLPTTPALATVSFAPLPYTGKQIVTNAAESRFWVGYVSGVTAGDGGIYTGTTIRTMTIAVAATYRVTGIALSADEATVYFTSRGSPTTSTQHALWSFPASCLSLCTPVLVLAAPARTEFRGLVRAPREPQLNASAPSPSAPASPSVSPTSSPPVNASRPCAAGTAGAAGVCTLCAAGTFSAAGAASCTPCAAGTFSAVAGSAACTACPSGGASFVAANTQAGQTTCGCLGGSPGNGFAPGPPPKCIACPAGSSNPVNGSAVCVCSAPHTVWVGPAPGACMCDIATGWSALGVPAGAGGPVCQQCSAGAATCPAGTYQTSACTATTGIVCSTCSVCGEGSRRVSDCGGGANRVCALCSGANEYAYGPGGENAAACQTCGAGSAPTATKGGCVCADPHATWSEATNTCTCNGPQWHNAAGGSAPPCVIDLTAPSATASSSVTASKTGSATMTPSPTMSTGASLSASGSVSPTISTTSSVSRTPTITPSASPSLGSSPSSTSSVSKSSSPSQTPASATATRSPVAASASASRSATATASASFGSSNLGAGAGADAGSAATSPVGMIVAIVVGVCVVAGAAFYVATQSRRRAVGGRGGAAGERGGEWAPAVVVANNPLGGSAGPGVRAGGRAAFSPVAAGGGAAGGTPFIECVDTARGVKYYANAATGETVWALPPGGFVSQRMAK